MPCCHVDSIMPEILPRNNFNIFFCSVCLCLLIYKEENKKKNASGVTAPCAGDFISYCTSVY